MLEDSFSDILKRNSFPSVSDPEFCQSANKNLLAQDKSKDPKKELSDSAVNSLLTVENEASKQSDIYSKCT